MAHPTASEQPSASTTWVWETRKIRSRPQGQKRSTPKASRWSRYSARPRRERITLEIHYRGGAECWYEVRARGSLGRFHGATALHDVFEEISQGAEFYTGPSTKP